MVEHWCYYRRAKCTINAGSIFYHMIYGIQAIDLDNILII